ncbi:hypothetical protein NQ318_010871 [Aromia moschata]|uniref:Mos1 transposase HTH domain-containing protein n=1 Tax=Aromia moschata TaxID=1265417 RepID=A0AAV8XQ69_9CUCU|nr:hypothetical protein NQ318_010871 [Aromia moschata]
MDSLLDELDYQGYKSTKFYYTKSPSQGASSRTAMNRLLEQHYAVKFCFKCHETHEMIKSAYGDDAMGRSSVFEWHKLFREGREKVEDDQRSGRRSTIKNDENMVKIKNLLNSGRSLSVRMISEHLNLPPSIRRFQKAPP